MRCHRPPASAALLLLLLLLGSNAASGAPPPAVPGLGPFCEGDGWTPIEPDDLTEELVTGTMELGWAWVGHIWGITNRWRNCTRFSQLERQVVGCRQVRLPARLPADGARSAAQLPTLARAAPLIAVPL